MGLMALLLHGGHAKQFEQFYPYYQQSLTIMENTTECHKNYALDIQRWGASDPNVCKSMVNCLMTNNGDINKADWSSALVLLGLTPTILGQLGSTLKEKARLSFQSPVLGFLCILGAPSIPFERPWTKKNSPDTPPRNHFASEERWIFHPVSSRRQGRGETIPKWMMAWIALKYPLAAAAAVNVLQNVITLGQRTIISWKCTWSHLELAWILTALVPVLFAVVAVFFEWRKDRRPSSLSSASGKNRKRHDKKDILPILFDSLSNIICAVHVIFGTVMLSSVMFIGTLDALGVVGRFTASTLVCQLVTAFELKETEEEIGEGNDNERAQSDPQAQSPKEPSTVANKVATKSGTNG